MNHVTRSLLGRSCAILLAFGILLVFFQLVVRPWYLNWNATSAESVAQLPGDEYLVATTQTTHAISIDAPASEVWPWLAQLGQDRGGFYSYELLEDLIGAQMPNVDELKPSLQTWRVGDKLWMYPPHRLEGRGHAVLQRLDAGSALVFGMRQIGTPRTAPFDATWSFVLRSPDADHARLLVRGRGAGVRTLGLRIIDRFAFEPVHFMMERKMLDGIKARAEGHSATPLLDAMEIGVFATCIYMILSACLRLLREPEAVPAMFCLILALGIVFQALTFLQPPWYLGGIPVAWLGFYVGGNTFVRPRGTATSPPSSSKPVRA